jgi:membrane-bound serine protease (ClpP class)
MLDAGVWVRCIEVKGGKVIVREMEAPPDLSEISHETRPEPPPPPPPEPPPPPKRPADDFDLDLGLDK